MIGSSISVGAGTGASSTAIVSASAAGSGTFNYPFSAIIKNPLGGVTVFLGGPTVDGTGYPLAAGEIISMDLLGEPLFGTTNGNGTQTVYTLRRGTVAP